MAPDEPLTRRTAERYGCLWANSRGPVPASYHYEKVRALLPSDPLHGLVLDAGCGDGIDTARMAAADSCRVVGVDLTEEGVRRTAQRTAGRRNVMVIRGDLERLPLQDGRFDFVYSYGVLHHLPHPAEGFRELVRVLRPGGWLAVYVYEDFAARAPAERALLRLVNGLRRVTVAMPPRALFGLCRLASPLVFAGLTVPARVLGRWQATQGLSERIPYRQGRSPMDLTGDLYDRFAAPLEHRYDRATVEQWFRQAGLTQVATAPLRGWVGWGVKPGQA